MKNFWTSICRAPDDGGAAAGSGEAPAEATAAAVAPVEAPKGDEPSPTQVEPPAEAVVPMEVFTRRVGQLTAQKAKLEADLALARVQSPAPVPAAAPAPTGLTQNDVELAAAQMLADRDFNSRCNAVWEKGTVENKDFAQSIAQMQAVAGGQLPRQFLEAALEVDAPADVLYALAKDPKKTQDILDLPPAKQGVALMKYELELKGKKAASAAKVSKAPDPVGSVVGGTGTGSSGSFSPYDTKAPVEDWIANRNRELRERAGRR